MGRQSDDRPLDNQTVRRLECNRALRRSGVPGLPFGSGAFAVAVPQAQGSWRELLRHRRARPPVLGRLGHRTIDGEQAGRRALAVGDRRRLETVTWMIASSTSVA